MAGKLDAVYASSGEKRKDFLWKTFIFPEKEGTYLLPIKKLVRAEQKIKKGDAIEFELELIL